MWIAATVLFAVIAFAMNCGHPNDNAKTKSSSKPKLPNQGFVLAKETYIEAAPEACPDGQKGGRIRVVPMDENKASFSSVTCYTTDRVATDEREGSEEHKYPERKEFAIKGAEQTYTFAAETFKDFCAQNKIEDLGAQFFDDVDSSRAVLKTSFGLMSCDIDPSKIKKIIVIASRDYPGSFFDLRLLKYFPNVVKFEIKSNAVVGQQEVAPIGSVKIMAHWPQGTETKQESDLLASILPVFPNLSILEITPHRGVSGEFTIDISSIVFAPKLEVLMSGVNVDGLRNISSHESIRIMELRSANDQMKPMPKNLEMFRYEIDTKAFNWSDQKNIHIHDFRFER